MDNLSALEELSQKISMFMENYHNLKNENIKLSEALLMAREKLEVQEQEIVRLNEEEELRVMEIEEMTQKLVSVLS